LFVVFLVDIDHSEGCCIQFDFDHITFDDIDGRDPDGREFCAQSRCPVRHRCHQ